MRHSVFANLFFTVILIVVAGTAGAQPIQTGKPFPPVQFPRFMTVDSQLVSIESLRGKWVFLDFWATWCGPCIQELPDIQLAFDQFGDRVVFISVSLDDEESDVASFRQGTHPMPWNHLFLGSDSPLIESLGIVSIPRPILIAPDGTVAAYLGELRGKTLIKTLNRLLGPAGNQSGKL